MSLSGYVAMTMAYVLIRIRPMTYPGQTEPCSVRNHRGDRHERGLAAEVAIYLMSMRRAMPIPSRLTWPVGIRRRSA